MRTLEEWFAVEPGLSLVSAERERLALVLPNLFGFHILQIGGFGQSDLLESSRVNHKVVLGVTCRHHNPWAGRAICEAAALPIQSYCVDVVVLAHVLEFETDPHAVLREVERILIGEGHIVIMAFNPLSFFGIWRKLLAWWGEPPWSGRFYRFGRVKDWLHLLGFDIVQSQAFYFRPPLRRQWLLKRLRWLEKLGKHIWAFFGGVYIIVGKKRLVRLTPIKEQWRLRRELIAGGVAEPSPSGVDRSRSPGVR